MNKTLNTLGIISSILSLLLCLFYSELLYVISDDNAVLGLGLYAISFIYGYKIFSIYPTFRKNLRKISELDLNKKLRVRIALNFLGFLIAFVLIAVFSTKGDYLRNDIQGVMIALGLNFLVHIILLIILFRFKKLIPLTGARNKPFLKKINLQKMQKIKFTSNEIVILSTILGTLMFGLLGWYFGNEERNNLLERKEFLFNYIAAFIGFIVTAGLTYLLLNRFTLKDESDKTHN